VISEPPQKAAFSPVSIAACHGNIPLEALEPPTILALILFNIIPAFAEINYINKDKIKNAVINRQIQNYEFFYKIVGVILKPINQNKIFGHDSGLGNFDPSYIFIVCGRV
jgi:hypothetical protein